MNEAKTKLPTKRGFTAARWLELGLLWLARREVRKAQERMEWVENTLRETGRLNAMNAAREAIREIKETADWMRPRSNDQRQATASERH